MKSPYLLKKNPGNIHRYFIRQESIDVHEGLHIEKHRVIWQIDICNGIVTRKKGLKT